MDIAAVINEFGFNLEASRGQERESDQYGFDFMVKAGYNPQGMVQVFEMFRKLKGSGSSPEFLSTHPDDKNRINALSKRLEDYKKNSRNKPLPPITPLPFQTSATRGSGK